MYAARGWLSTWKSSFGPKIQQIDHWAQNLCQNPDHYRVRQILQLDAYQWFEGQNTACFWASGISPFKSPENKINSLQTRFSWTNFSSCRQVKYFWWCLRSDLNSWLFFLQTGVSSRSERLQSGTVFSRTSCLWGDCTARTEFQGE